METKQRILGRIVGQPISKEQLEKVAGGDCNPHQVCCNGCQNSTSFDEGNGPGCRCD